MIQEILDNSNEEHSTMLSRVLDIFKISSDSMIENSKEELMTVFITSIVTFFISGVSMVMAAYLINNLELNYFKPIL